MSRIAEAQTEEERVELKNQKKSSKEKKGKKGNKSRSKVQSEDVEEPSTVTKKRKRETLPDEIEIDVSLPEPASKKAARKAKKAKVNPKPTDTGDDEKPSETKEKEEKKNAQRSDYGVWIGNLPWSATKDTVREFLVANSDITEEQITRVNMPAPTKPPNPRWTTKPLNKGFAYVDFSTELAMYSAIALTETKMDGRALLIKNAKNFEGRPAKPKSEEEDTNAASGKPGNPPNKRIFVGNLAFEVSKEDLFKHFGQCGEVADIHMATFEDSGKCKGYAWVTFGDVDAATSAVKGFIYKEEGSDSDAEAEGKKKGKKRKWMINRLMGRDLRCEFAEDPTVRYQKRFGKEKEADMQEVHPDRQRHFDDDGGDYRPRSKKPQGRRVDPRTIKPGAAHTSAPRASQSIVESQGKKITFD